MFRAEVSALELAWSLVALFGSAMALTLLAQIWLSYRAVMVWIADGRLVLWGPRHRFVLGFLAGIGLLLMVWLGFVALGVNAMATPAPVTPDRVAASERGGWILVALELILFGAQGILVYAWVAIGRPTLTSGAAPRSPVALVFKAIDLGRDMGHRVNNEAQIPLGVLEQVAANPSVPTELRMQASDAARVLDRLVAQIHEIHQAVKDLEGSPR